MQGTLILVIGPSGSGKSALIAYVRKVAPDMVFPVSCTTRTKRQGEKEGETYYFITEEEFDARIKDGAFLEWASYGGHRYGTLKSEVLPKLKAGKSIVREVEVQGAHILLQKLPRENCATIFVSAGSWAHLEKRIRARASMSDEELAIRHARYEAEMAFQQEADVRIENPDGKLEEAKHSFVEAIEQLRKK